jgi:hypothetical protein
MEIAHLKRLTELLHSSSFELQRCGSEIAFVRSSESSDLFERLELTPVGRRKEAVVLSVALAAVWDIRAQFRGLVARGGLSELCNDPENGRVIFSANTDVQAWIERLAEVGPSHVRSFAQQEAHNLWENTQVARIAARNAFALHVGPQVTDLLASTVSLSHEQRRVVEHALTRPFVIGSDDLAPEYKAAVAALVLSGDSDVLHLGQATVGEGRRMPLIRQMQEVPERTIWKIRLVVDMILRARERVAAIERERLS